MSAERIARNFSFSSLVTADQVAYVFAVVGELPRLNLSFDPVVLLVGDGDCLACSTHKTASKECEKIILLI